MMIRLLIQMNPQILVLQMGHQQLNPLYILNKEKDIVTKLGIVWKRLTKSRLGRSIGRSFFKIKVGVSQRVKNNAHISLYILWKYFIDKKI